MLLFWNQNRQVPNVSCSMVFGATLKVEAATRGTGTVRRMMERHAARMSLTDRPIQNGDRVDDGLAVLRDGREVTNVPACIGA